jgi:hypothetical protein
MAGQPLDGSWAKPRQQPQSYEQAPPPEKAPHQSYPAAQQSATETGDEYPQAGDFAAHEAYQAQRAYQAQQAYQASVQAAQQAARSKGFVASLFDFSFSSFVTPKVIRALYVLATLWIAVLTIAFCSFCVHFAGSGSGTLIFIIITAPILFLLGLGSVRVVFEVFMVLHRLNENIQAIRDRSDMS